MKLSNLIPKQLSTLTALAVGGAPRRPRRWMDITPAELRGPAPMLITRSALRAITTDVGHRPAETGGALAGAKRDGVVRHFRFDTSSRNSAVTFSPDVDELNKVMKTEWRKSSFALLGFAHSHPAGHTRPSGGDLVYADRILQARPSMDRLLVPIVQTVPDTGRFWLHGAAAYRDGRSARVVPVDVRVIPDLVDGPSLDDTVWDRVRAAYDLPAMATTRLVVVGCGGSAAFVEEMVRSGVGEVVLIDSDTIERPNVGTQQVYLSDVGRPKVHALASRLTDVSRHVRIVTLAASLDDLTDADMHQLVHAPLPNTVIGGPGLTLLCGFTDDFWAQSRVNRLALQFGVAQLQAGVYREGRGVELFYGVPDVTDACARCALHSRYRQYLVDGYENDVTSRGTPLLATTRLNQVKAEVAMAIIHATAPNADPDHPAGRRWSAVFDYVGRRNFVQVGLEATGDEQLGLSLFGNVRDLDALRRLDFDQTVWRARPPRPDCADCGGDGHRRIRPMPFEHTRLARPVTDARTSSGALVLRALARQLSGRPARTNHRTPTRCGPTEVSA